MKGGEEEEEEVVQCSECKKHSKNKTLFFSLCPSYCYKFKRVIIAFVSTSQLECWFWRMVYKFYIVISLFQSSVLCFQGHPSCLGLTDEMVPQIHNYDWQCMECKTCIECKDPSHEVSTVLQLLSRLVVCGVY